MLLKKRDYIRMSGMFVRDRDRVLKSLLALREDICSYSPGTLCDCKYGYGEDDASSEACGCPEISVACFILARLTQEEYEEIIGRPLLCELDANLENE